MLLAWSIAKLVMSCSSMSVEKLGACFIHIPNKSSGLRTSVLQSYGPKREHLQAIMDVSTYAVVDIELSCKSINGRLDERGMRIRRIQTNICLEKEKAGLLTEDTNINVSISTVGSPKSVMLLIVSSSASSASQLT